jgi:hypothetical protein
MGKGSILKHTRFDRTRTLGGGPRHNPTHAPMSDMLSKVEVISGVAPGGGLDRTEAGRVAEVTQPAMFDEPRSSASWAVA